MRVYGLLDGIRKQLCPGFRILAERKNASKPNAKKEPRRWETTGLLYSHLNWSGNETLRPLYAGKWLKLGTFERKESPGGAYFTLKSTKS